MHGDGQHDEPSYVHELVLPKKTPQVTFKYGAKTGYLALSVGSNQRFENVDFPKSGHSQVISPASSH